ncbi:FxLYD domain-containing protein [Streptomyces sp. NPDC006553]|uniref:FxLYD domain-containing protein n=1 Tax=unclassified Streptomyces TaxID=2593676 RepID=UPI00225098E5|nr:FxLYD domain-containing protein [Streptomyces sp. NBC_00233]MCX5230660.1 FxLYD domain-containing protein [Streptomyces sp. NBC_00233]
MNPTSARARRAVRARAVSAAAAVVVTALGAVGLVSCDTGNDDTGGPTFSERPTAPDTAGFSGELPSSVASSGAAAVESARASASSAAASASAREAERKASIGAEIERTRQEAEDELKDVKAPGNALSDVAMTGKPRADTGGVLTVVLNITNTTNEEASYAVQVDFLDPSGKVVETQFVGVEDLEPGERQQPLVISRQPPEPVLTPRLTKAQRY